jgi:hypothetical protein
MDIVLAGLAAPIAAVTPIPGVRPEPCGSPVELANALRGQWDAAILLTGGIPDELLAAIAESVRASGRPVIEVRSDRWDGATPSPVSAACRGVISGFGPAGAAAAAALLQREAGAA